MAHSLREAGACCHPTDNQASFPAPHELESDDEQERGRAFEDVGRGLASFLTTTSLSCWPRSSPRSSGT
jgi:hypothetical protein